jgi:hydroxyacylglutathione hydrolase
MLVVGFPAGTWQTNCYVVATAPGEQCVVVDPGQDSVRGIEEVVREHRLAPVAVLLTHGHLDHTWSVVPVCEAHDVPAYLHPADRYMLSDPGIAFGQPPGTPLFGGLTFAEPSDLRPLAGGETVTVAGLDFVVAHAPGHTEGSVTFRLPEVLFSGDVLFRDSIGRVDLPGGSFAAMLDTLARVVLPLPDDLRVLSGHGPETTIGRERAHNPYLAEAASAAGLAEPRGRGL